MVDTTFMNKKFKVQELFERYMQDIKNLQYPGLNELELRKLKNYLGAFNVVKNTSVMDLAKFAVSFGRHTSPQIEMLNKAFPVVLGRNVAQPQQVDLDYARILLDYAQAIHENRKNVKDWIIHFIINSKYSPVKQYFDSELNRVISDTYHNIRWYEQNI